MAYIKKARARKELARDNPSGSVSNRADDHGAYGLRFDITIGDYKVSLTHLERDAIVKQWNDLAKNWGEGK